MATITPINTTTDTPASAATKTNDNFTSLKADVDANTASINSLKQSQMFPILRNSTNITNNPNNDSDEDYSISTAANTETLSANFFVPEHASSVDCVKLILLPDTTEVIQADFTANFASNGEGKLTHNVSSSNNTIAVTINEVTEWELTSIVFTDLAPGDYGGLKITSDTSDIRVLGLVVTWNV